MTIKKKKLFKKNIVILFVLVALLVLVTYLLNPKNQEDKQLSPASKTFYKTDSQGKDDYVLMKTGNINQLTIGAYQGCEIVSFYNALVYLDKTQGKTVTDWIEELPYVGTGEAILTVVMLGIRGQLMMRFLMEDFRQFGQPL